MFLPGSLFIDGTWHDARSGRLLQVLDPVDGSLVVAHDAAGPEDVVRAVAAARAAFEAGTWSDAPAAERADVLHRTAFLLVRDQEHVARLETRDTGKALRESRVDVDDVVAVLRYYGPGGRGRHPARRRRAGRRQPGGGRARRRLRADHALELPAAPHLLEARPCSRRGLHRGGQAQ